VRKDLKSKNEKAADAERRRNVNRVNYDLRRSLDEIMAEPLDYSDEELARIYRHTRDHAAARLAVLVTKDDFAGQAALQGLHDGAVRGLLALKELNAAPVECGDVHFIFSSSPAPPIDDSEPDE
jgi:hypothetical protein